MSPEQVQGHRADLRSDIYAVGAVFYELLSYRRAFSGDGVAVIQEILKATPEPITNLCPDLHPDVAHIVNRALDKDPGARYQDLRALRVDLAAARKHYGGDAGMHLTPWALDGGAPPATPGPTLAAGEARPDSAAAQESPAGSVDRAGGDQSGSVGKRPAVTAKVPDALPATVLRQGAAAVPGGPPATILLGEGSATVVSAQEGPVAAQPEPGGKPALSRADHELQETVVAPKTVTGLPRPAPPAKLDDARSGTRSRLFIGAIVIVALVFAVNGLLGWLKNRPVPAAAGEAVALNITPWANIDSITRKTDGQKMSTDCRSTPPRCSLRLAPGEYQVQVSNPSYAVSAGFDFVVVQGRSLDVLHSIPGFNPEAEVDRILGKRN
jgi:hypothetical protein